MANYLSVKWRHSVYTKIQAGFVKATNSNSWEEAITKYVDFASSEKLEQFQKLNFNLPQLPTEFIKYCQLAISSKRVKKRDSSLGNEKLFVAHNNTQCTGVIKKEDFMTLSVVTLNDVLHEVSISH